MIVKRYDHMVFLCIFAIVGLGDFPPISLANTFVKSQIKNLEFDWDAVDGASQYEVLIEENI